MAVPNLFHDLRLAGVQFTTDGERINWRYGDGLMEPDAVEVLRNHKASIIDFLQGERIGQMQAGIASAFAEYDAMNDPHSQEAWRY